VIYSNCIQALVDFYSLLGLDFKLERHETGPTHFAAQSGGIVFEIYPIEGGSQNEETSSSRLLLGFQVQDIRLVLNALQTQGYIDASWEDQLTQQAHGALRLSIKDVDGRQVLLTQEVSLQ
jgi:hypothetical protein